MFVHNVALVRLERPYKQIEGTAVRLHELGCGGGGFSGMRPRQPCLMHQRVEERSAEAGDSEEVWSK